MSGPVYPFTAIVGQERLRLALVLAAVYPEMGGVLVRGGKGTAKSTAARGLARLLPEVEAVAGCPFRCDPDRPAELCEECRERLERHGHLPRERVPAPFVDLPLGATEDRVLGTLDWEGALREGKRRFEPGLLARAHRGILYVDEVNLLPDHLVDVLLDVAASGVNVVEREGVSVRHPASFILIGTMNPEEGELRPQFLDRFGLAVEVDHLDSPEVRAEAVRRRIAFEQDPEGFWQTWAAAEAAERSRIAEARKRLARVRVDDALLRLISRICLDFGAEGLRADLVVYKAAVARAAYQGRERVTPDDVREAAALALPHRRRRQPFDDGAFAHQELQQVLERHLPAGPRPRAAGDGPSQRQGDEGSGGGGDQDRAGDGNEDESEHRDTDGNGGADAPAGRAEGRETTRGSDGAQGSGEARASGSSQVSQGGPRGVAPWRVEAPGPLFLPAAITLQLRRRCGAADGRRVEAGSGDGRGRPAGVKRSARRSVRDLAVAATLRSAAAKGCAPGAAAGGDGPVAIRVTLEDLRVWHRRVRSGACVLFVLDASGSMGVARRMRATKAAVLALLGDAYRRRDRVGLVVCRGARAELAMPFTRSIERARQLLNELPTGGRTPLADGLAVALQVLSRERWRSPGAPLLLVLVTDGKANVARDGGDPYEEARAWGRRVARAGIPAVVADAADPREPLPLAAELAEAMGAVRLSLQELENRSLVRILVALGG